MVKLSDEFVSNAACIHAAFFFNTRVWASTRHWLLLKIRQTSDEFDNLFSLLHTVRNRWIVHSMISPISNYKISQMLLFIQLFRTRIFDLSPNYLCCASGKISWQIQRFFYHHMSWSKNSWKIGVGDCLWLTPQQEATDSLLQSVFVQFSHLVKQCHEQIKSFLTRMNPWIDMF